MKKSAIYLGASAAILAIAGAFTTKSSTKVTTVTAYTIGGKLVGQVTCTTSTANLTCKTALGTALYTQDGTKLRTIH